MSEHPAMNDDERSRLTAASPFERLYTRHAADVQRYLRRRMGNFHDMQEVLQDLWFQVAQMTSFPADGEELAFLCVIADRRRKDHLKRQFAQKRDPRKTVEYDELCAVAASEEDVSQNLSAAELLDLPFISSRQRQVWVMLADGYTQEEIAESLHVDGRTVRRMRGAIAGKIRRHFARTSPGSSPAERSVSKMTPAEMRATGEEEHEHALGRDSWRALAETMNTLDVFDRSGVDEYARAIWLMVANGHTRAHIASSFDMSVRMVDTCIQGTVEKVKPYLSMHPDVVSQLETLVTVV